MPHTDSPSRTSSPDRSLVNILKHPSLMRHGNHSTAHSLPIPDDEKDRSVFKRSVNKLKDRSRRNSEDTERRSSFDPARRLSKLVPHRGKRRKSAQSGDGASTENNNSGPERGLRDYNGLGYTADGLGISAENHSEDSLGERPSSITSSLLTDDDDVESPSFRPAFDTRPSHAGYLTLSSPLINAGTADASEKPIEVVEESSAPQQLTSHTYQAMHQTSEIASSQTSLPLFPTESTTAATRRPLQNLSVTSSGPLHPPETMVTPPTPVIPQAHTPEDGSPRRMGGSRYAGAVLPARPESLPPFSAPITSGHRRGRSGTLPPTKSFNPLTPAIEEAKTPGGSLVQPSGGFFSSVFNATQNAVNQISTSFSNASPVAGQRPKSGAGPAGGEEVILTSEKDNLVVDPASLPATEPAIATIGSGNLSFSHLGITETKSDARQMTSKEPAIEHMRRSMSVVQQGTFPDKHEEVLAAVAVSAAYSERLPIEKAPSATSDGVNERPRSVASAVGSLNDTTPPASMTNGVDSSGPKRSNSVRSRLSDRRRRHRASSAATGSAIAAALTASHAAIANPASKGRPTGFAVASSKRNKEFHQLFKSVPEDDFLIEDCSAALHRDILLQGRLYVSERNICFSSNILGWVTNLVISFDEVQAMEKRMTAVIFPNAITIQTAHAKHTFASLIGRETTYDLLLAIWKTRHANINATEYGHAINGDGSDGKHEHGESSEDSEEESDQYYDEDEDDDRSGSLMDGSEHPSDAGNTVKGGSRKLSPGAVPSGGTISPSKHLEVPDGASAGVSIGGDFPGPQSHAPTECIDQETHYEKQLVDTTIPAPLGKIYTMFFGPQSGMIMRKFFVDDQKSPDVQLEDDKKGLGEEQKSFSYSYVKLLTASMGPKQTKCIVTQTLDHFDLEKAVSVTCSTQTPDVPSGNAFVTKTKYCLMWGPGNSTRIIASCTIEWAGKSWLKGPIEKGANDGQLQHCKDLVAFFKSQLPGKISSKMGHKGVKSKGSRRKKSMDDGIHTEVAEKHVPATATATGNTAIDAVLRPLREIIGTLGDIIGPVSNSTIVLAVLFAVVTVLFLRQTFRTSPVPSSQTASPVGPAYGDGRFTTAQRLAAYEEMWQREEEDLWSWMEDRIGLDQLITSPPSAGDGAAASPGRRRDDNDKDEASTGPRRKVRDADGMNERQVDEAIRVTEEKLRSLKQMVERKKDKRAETVRNGGGGNG